MIACVQIMMGSPAQRVEEAAASTLIVTTRTPAHVPEHGAVAMVEICSGQLVLRVHPAMQGRQLVERHAHMLVVFDVVVDAMRAAEKVCQLRATMVRALWRWSSQAA